LTSQSCLIILNKLATLKPAQAWEHGTNVRTAMKSDEVTTFAALYAITKDMLDYMEMNKTLRTQDEIQHAVSMLLSEFPAYKLEEWKIVMDRFKSGHFGNMFERLKLPELREAFLKYADERSIMMENNYHATKKIEPEPLSEAQRILMKQLVKDLDLKSDTDFQGRWKHIQHPNTTE
jgi:hypothetical protein